MKMASRLRGNERRTPSHARHSASCPGLTPGIHVLGLQNARRAIGRDEPGHDKVGTSPAMTAEDALTPAR